MQEIFFTILVIWVLFKILSSSTTRHIFTVNINKPREEKRKQEGETKIEYIPGDKKPPRTPGKGEYVDFEEIK